MQLRQAFAVKDLGPLRYFLGTEVHRDRNGFFLNQAKYASELLERSGMTNCKIATTLADTKSKPSTEDGVLINDASAYRSLAGALQYLTLTRPDIAYAVQQVCLHMHAPRDVHQTMLKRILRYIKGTMHLDVQLAPVTTASVTAYFDADWAGCPDTRRSTSGYCVFLGDSPVSWSSKRQLTVSRSSAETEYRAIANAVAECTWLRHLLAELRSTSPGYRGVLRQHVCSVHVSQPRPSSVHETLRAGHPLCSREGGAWPATCSSCAKRMTTSRHLHKRVAVVAVHRLQGQSRCRFAHVEIEGGC
jgi:hypothetical protein